MLFLKMLLSMLLLLFLFVAVVVDVVNCIAVPFSDVGIVAVVALPVHGVLFVACVSFLKSVETVMRFGGAASLRF